MRRAISAERAELLRQATAQSVLEHLRAAGAGVPSHLLAIGLAAATAEMIRNVKPRNRAAVIARCRAALDAAERRQLCQKTQFKSAAVTR